jgi:hypothetical protein
MDMKVYYQKLREIEKTIPAEGAVLVSQATPDGGKAGVRTEAPPYTAAKMIVDGVARLATEEEAREFREQMAEAKRAADQAAAASRLQVTVVSEADLRAIKNGGRPAK